MFNPSHFQDGEVTIINLEKDKILLQMKNEEGSCLVQKTLTIQQAHELCGKLADAVCNNFNRKDIS